MDRRFNLQYEPWIPVVDHGRESLRNVLVERDGLMLGGNAVQKIVVLKLLLATAQRAYTPEDDEDWKNLGEDGLKDACHIYLDSHIDDFWLHGDKPFLQIPGIHAAKVARYGSLSPEVSSGNATVLFSSQIEKELPDPDRALLILQMSGYALSGKQTDNSIVLSPGYDGKSNAKGNPSSGRVGPSLGHFGHQHCFYMGRSVLETVYMNLLTAKDISSTGMFPDGVGIPPWEEPPEGEADEIAQRLQKSYMGRLIPMSRFMLDTTDGIHYSEGIRHFTHNEGVWDPSASVRFGVPKSYAIWIDPAKRPWRQLPAILAFMTSTAVYVTYQIKSPFSRLKESFNEIGIWAGGIRVSNNAGERYCTGTDDYVESSFQLNTSDLGQQWYLKLTSEMDDLDHLSKRLWGGITGYLGQMKVQNNEKVSAGVSLFWQLCEQNFQELINSCVPGGDVYAFRKQSVTHLNYVYDTYCPHSAARQIAAWAKNRPDIGGYLSNPEKKKEETLVK